MDVLPKNKSQGIYDQYTQFEKQHGDNEGIDDVIVAKRRQKYETEIKANPRNYDTWLDYARLEEDTGNIDKIRELYKRAVAEYPPIEEKRLWRRYIYILAPLRCFRGNTNQRTHQTHDAWKSTSTA